jgi:hypothetical protein
MQVKIDRAVLALGFLVVSLGISVAQDMGTLDKEKAEQAFKQPPAYSPYVNRDFPTRPFFGDTHLHTAFAFIRSQNGAVLTCGLLTPLLLHRSYASALFLSPT